MAYKVTTIPLAKKDIQNAKNYLAKDKASPLAAARLLADVKECYSFLASMPHIYQGFNDADLQALSIRRAVIKNYILVFQIDEDTKTVRVLRFLHGSQDYAKRIFSSIPYLKGGHTHDPHLH